MGGVVVIVSKNYLATNNAGDIDSTSNLGNISNLGQIVNMSNLGNIGSSIGGNNQHSFIEFPDSKNENYSMV